MYKWIHYAPLTSSEAMRVFKKGIKVYAIGGSDSFIVTRRQEIKRHSKRGGMFAADRDVVIQKETHFIAHYEILPNKENGKAITVEKKYKNRSELQDDCMDLLTKTMRKHGLKEDGTYQAILEIDRYLFGEFERTDDYDEGEIVMQNGVVTRVPSGFWLPF